ncbi:MAG: FAD-dependent oxidoreductase, partial [Desulfotomaculaceae bacterium]
AALIIGGGVAGMTSALNLAEQGYRVHLLDKSNQLGGNARLISKGFNNEDINALVTGLSDRVNNNPLIDIYNGCDIREVSGYKGNFTTMFSDGRQVKHGVTIIATGAEEAKPVEYLYGQDQRVMTQLELDQAIAAAEPRVKNARSIVMIQCVGSRDEQRPYCSRICCSRTMQLALQLKEINPDCSIIVLYRDIRTYGFLEDNYRAAREQGVLFFRYEQDNKPVVETVPNNGGDMLRVTATDHVFGGSFQVNPDLVVLAAPVAPPESNRQLSQLLKVPLNQDGFFQEAHMKLRPVDFASEGVFMCGLAHGPKNIEETITQAKAAAGRASVILSRDTLESGGVVAVVQQDKCAACLTCVRLCPFKAPTIKNHRAEIESVICQGCGTCASECPNKAITLQGYSDSQLSKAVDGLFV